jgi:hypothetical protein
VLDCPTYITVQRRESKRSMFSEVYEFLSCDHCLHHIAANESHPIGGNRVHTIAALRSGSLTMTSNEATLCAAQPAAAEDDAVGVVVVADVREEPQCEITVVECDRPHNTAHGVQQRQSDDLQVQPVLLLKRLSNFFVHRCFLF